MLLRKGDRFPDYLIVRDVLIEDSNLFDKISVSGLPSVNNKFDEKIKKGHIKKLRRKAYTQNKIFVVQLEKLAF